MSKKIQIAIPIPCHENWDAMTPVQKGKFCGSCQKQVIDFSNMNDRQVAEFFKKPSTGSVCGRFMTDQLDRAIDIPKKRIPWVRYFFQFALPAFLVSIKGSAQKPQGKITMNKAAKERAISPLEQQLMTVGMIAMPVCHSPVMGDMKVNPVKNITVGKTIKGDTLILPEVVITSVTSRYTGELMGKVSLFNQALPAAESFLKGKVVDEKGNSVPYVTIRIKGATTGTITDSNGLFSIRPVLNPDLITLVASNVSFLPAEVVIDRKHFNEMITIKLEPARSFEVGELVVCRKPPAKKEVKPVPVMPAIKDEQDVPLFKVFPNPVLSGTNLNIEWKQTEEGYFSLQLLNQSGQSVHQQEIWIDAEARLLSVDVPPVAAGSYFLILRNKNSGKKFTEKIIIQ